MHRRAFLAGTVGLAVFGAAGLRADWRSDMAMTRIGVGIFEGVEELDLAGHVRGAHLLGAVHRARGRGLHGRREHRGAARLARPEDDPRPVVGRRRRPRRVRAAGREVGAAAHRRSVPAAAARPALVRDAPGERLHGRRRVRGRGPARRAARDDPLGLDRGSRRSTARTSRSAPTNATSTRATSITSQGVSAGIDMALYLVMRLDSKERAREVRRYIQYDPEPPV